MAPKVSVIVPVYNVEPYIEAMLKSVQDQTFTDFEVIIVNDGSPDNSQAIIDRFCEEDSRFVGLIQENGGVASARNTGLDQARGDYIVFFDPDDRVFPNAIADLYHSVQERMADLAIARAEFASLDEVHIPKPLEELSRKKYIDRYDFNLNRTFSPWNKIFRRSVIENNHLRFAELDSFEDAVFIYEFIHSCGKITGCDSVVYQYVRRPPWESRSLTQIMTADRMHDMYRAFDYMAQAVLNGYEQRRSQLSEDNAPAIAIEELECKYMRFRSDMYVRFTQVNLIDEFYRYVWKLSQEVIDSLAGKILEYKDKIYPDQWESNIIKKNPDLAINKKILMSQEDFNATPILSFVLSSNVPADFAGITVSSIYSQTFSSFEIIVDESQVRNIDEAWRSKINFYTLQHNGNVSDFKKAALKKIRGQFVIFIDEPVAFSRHLVRKMFREMRRKDVGGLYDFISVPLVHMHEDGFDIIEASKAAFVNEFVNIKRRSKFNELDYTWSNKMFLVSYLRGKKILFTGDNWKDINRLYNNSVYGKITELSMATSLDNDDILGYVRNPFVKLFYKNKIKKDEKITAYIESLQERKETRTEKFKSWRLQKMRDGYKFLTRKVIYPLYYKWCARKPVEDNKVLFIEPRLDKLTNSTAQIYERFKNSGKYTIHEHYLRDRYARYRDQYKRGMNFIKDFATARFAVIAEANDTLGCLHKRNETTVVNTWHGCGAFKKFGFSTAEKLFGGNLKQKQRYPLYHNLDIVTVSSPEVIWAYEEAMGLKGTNVVRALGVSRTDVFFDDEFIEKSVKKVRNTIPQAEGKKIIMYAPTFRGRIASAKGPGRLDIEKMAEALSDEYILIIKHHPLVKRPPQIPPDCKGVFAFDVSKSKDITIDDLICSSDICISDYSSLIYEYSLFEKPMIFFAFDLDEYFDWRGFYYNYEELTPGPVVTGTEEIINYIENIDTMFDKQQVTDFKQRFMSSCDGHATERIINTMMELSR